MVLPALHPPRHDGFAFAGVWLMPDAVVPGLGVGAVEDDEVSFVYGACDVHVVGGLAEAFFDDSF